MAELTGILLNGQLFDLDTGVTYLPLATRHAIISRLIERDLSRHGEPSQVLCLDDEKIGPSKRLLDLAARLAVDVPGTTHPLLSSRPVNGPRWFDVFPGECYHLLTALCRLLKPKLIWEFGTDLGISTLSMAEGLDDGAKIVTVDINPWQASPNTWFLQSDFDSGRVTQLVSDMKAPALFAQFGPSIADADLLFVDGPKDGSTEATFFKMLESIPFKNNPIIVVDDIRLLQMVGVWRSIARPKFDMTSFGHWAGTGLIDWSAR